MKMASYNMRRRCRSIKLSWKFREAS